MNEVVDVDYNGKIYVVVADFIMGEVIGEEKRNCRKCGKEEIIDIYHYTFNDNDIVEILYVDGEEIYDQLLIDKLLKSKIFKKRIEEAATEEINKKLVGNHDNYEELLCSICLDEHDKISDNIAVEEKEKIDFVLSEYRPRKNY